MSYQLSTFASREQIDRWRAFGVVRGWAVKDSTSVAVYQGETRLFDAPIAMHPFAEFTAPVIRFIGVSCVPIRVSEALPVQSSVVSVNNGKLYATDRRFILRRALGTDTDVSIPYRSVTKVLFKEGVGGLRNFGLQLDHSIVMEEIEGSMPVPDNTQGRSAEEFSQTVLMPYARELARQAIGGLALVVKAPKAGFMDTIAIATAKSSVDQAWRVYLAQRANEIGSDFIGAFLSFLNEIADTARSAREASTPESRILERIRRAEDSGTRESIIDSLAQTSTGSLEELNTTFGVLERVLHDPSPLVRIAVCKAAGRWVLLHVQFGSEARRQATERAAGLLKLMEMDNDPTVVCEAEAAQRRLVRPRYL